MTGILNLPGLRELDRKELEDEYHIKAEPAAISRLCPHCGELHMALGEVLIAININSKSAIHIARVYGERMRNFVGQYFWARGYFVSTVGRDEGVIRKCIRDQEKEDERLDQFNLV